MTNPAIQSDANTPAWTGLNRVGGLAALIAVMVSQPYGVTTPWKYRGAAESWWIQSSKDEECNPPTKEVLFEETE